MSIPPTLTGQTALACTPIALEDLDAPTRKTLGDVEELWVYSLPLTVRFRGVTHREGLLIRGHAGWGEAAPFAEYQPPEASRWLAAALASAHTAPPAPRRDRVAVNVTIPVVDPASAAQRVASSGGCATAKVKVAGPRSSLAEDCARVEAVAYALREEVGSAARVRVDVNGAWDVDQAVKGIAALDRAASCIGGLEYVEQPCATVEDLALVRRRVNVRIAADESIRRAEDPMRVVHLEAADVAVIKVAPLGGIDRALSIAADTGLDVVVSSALETSIGIGMGVRACAALDSAPFASGLATVQLLTTDVTTSPMLPVQGHISWAHPTPDLLCEGQRNVSKDTVEWWRSRLVAMAQYLPAL